MSALRFLTGLITIAGVILATSTSFASTDSRSGEVLMRKTSLSTIRMEFASNRLDADFAPYRVALTTQRLTIPAPTRPAKVNLGVFASVAISAARLPANAKFRNSGLRDYTALFGADCDVAGLSGCDTRFATRLRKATARAEGMGTAAMLALVNREVNLAMTYVPDSGNWGRGDYWANPSEMARKGAGDCEDFAIAKLWMLRALGLPADKLQIVVLSDVKRQVFHAVLVVHANGQSYVLDNLSENVRTDGAYPNYVPIMSFVGGKSYIHGFENRTTAVAYAGDLSKVSPGEGL